LWGELENQIKSQSSNVGNKMSIFAGPILDDQNDIDHNFGGGPVKVPRRFWKVVLVVEEAATTPTLRAYGFVLDQSKAIDEFGLEEFSLGEFATFQVALTEITGDSGVTFHADVLAADTMPTAPHESKRIRIKSLDDVRIPVPGSSRKAA